MDGRSLWEIELLDLSYGSWEGNRWWTGRDAGIWRLKGGIVADDFKVKQMPVCVGD